MTLDGCNAAVTIRTAYYRLSASLEDIPAFVNVSAQIMNWHTDIILPINQLNAAAMQKLCPLLRFDSKKAKIAFDTTLTDALICGLGNGTIERGYYFEKTGAITFPDGSICFLRGNELLGQCNRPYAVAPAISNMRLLGCGNCSLDILSLLLTSPYQVFLTFSFVILTSIRSLLIDSGIDLQAVLYIAGGQGLGKTTLATRIAGIYEQAGKPIGIVQAGSTHAAVNAMMVSSRDQPIIIDDLCLSASRDTARKRVDLASKLIRQGTGCIPIIKESGNSTVELPCEAGLILTAEFHLENLSDLTRCIIVPVLSHLSIPDDLTPDLIGDAVRYYSQWFVSHYHEEIGRFRTAVGDAVSFGDMDTRILTNYACLAAAFQSFVCSMGELNWPRNLERSLSDKMDKALNKALQQHQTTIEQVKDNFPVGNLSFCILEGYRNGAFDLTTKIEKLHKHEGIIWKGDLCLRKESLISFIRQQCGYHDWTSTRITRTLRDINAFVIQEEGTATVRLSKENDIPRVYRIRLNVLKDTAKKYIGGSFI